MTTAEAQEVSEEDFQEILVQTRHFIRSAVLPREQEILNEDQVPDDLRDQAKKMGLFGYANPQQSGGPQLTNMLTPFLPSWVAEPEDIADAVCWLASEKSRNVTAARITVDQGSTQY